MTIDEPGPGSHRIQLDPTPAEEAIALEATAARIRELLEDDSASGYLFVMVYGPKGARRMIGAGAGGSDELETMRESLLHRVNLAHLLQAQAIRDEEEGINGR